MASNVGELSEEFPVIKGVTWKIANFSNLPTTIGYYVKSPEFRFVGATWCLRLLTNGCVTRGFNHIGLHLLRVISYVPEHRIQVKIGFKTRHGEEYESYTSECTFNHVKNVWGAAHYLHRFTLKSLKQLLVPDGTVTVFCQMYLKEEATLPESVTQAEEKEVATNFQKLQLDYKKLLQSGEDSDVCLKVSGKEFRAHKCILRARSEVFASMFKYETKEKATGEIVIDDLDPDSFSDFLQHLYAGCTEALTEENVFHLYSAADKYDLQKLKSECREYMKHTLSIDTFCDFFALALRHQEEELLKIATNFFSKKLKDIIVTVKWQAFSKDHNTEVNKLFVKALVPGREINEL